MIATAVELDATLHQLARFVDMLEALRLDAEERKDYGQFAHLSQSYLHRIRELNGEIRDYLRAHPEEGAIPAVAGANP